MFIIALANTYGLTINVPVGTSVLVNDLAGNSVAGAIAALATPAAPTLTPSGTGGTLAAGTTYNYRIVAVNKYGVTLPGPQAASNATTTGTTSSIAISWAAVTGATSYQVYGRTAGAELLLATVTATNYTDTGAATPSGAMPAANTSGCAALQVALFNGVPAITLGTLYNDNTTKINTTNGLTLSFSGLAGYTKTFSCRLSGDCISTCNVYSDAQAASGGAH